MTFENVCQGPDQELTADERAVMAANVQAAKLHQERQLLMLETSISKYLLLSV
jgi:hypothetical protein